MVAFICVIIWIIIMLVLMFPFGLLENPQKRLSKGNSAIVIIVGAGSANLYALYVTRYIKMDGYIT